jgi:REP element-mobilizing transposase RayT
MARDVKERQASFRFGGWGGARDGAGRPRKPGAKLRHAQRAPLAARFPALVTLRALPGGPNLRRSESFAAIERALRAIRGAPADFRVVHFTVQTNHLHLLAEAAGSRALSRGMQGLAVRIARGVNAASERRGKLWADRFHARALRSPREVRVALCYVLQNTRRHVTTEREMLDPAWIDPRSSGPWFDGWRGGAPALARGDPPTASARTSLLSSGWRSAGLVAIDEVPPAAFHRRVARPASPVGRAGTVRPLARTSAPT